MSTVRKHTRITASGKRVTVRRHQRDDNGPGAPAGSTATAPAAPADPWPASTVREPAVSWGDDAPIWDDYGPRENCVIVHDDNARAEPQRDTGPSPYPHDIAKAELFAHACESLGMRPEMAMAMPAVRARIMRAIG